ncbi:MAG: hypothetical protein K9M08_14355 [Pirellula sp.]|nr:hypothetical protein [Pirellula sp.]
MRRQRSDWHKQHLKDFAFDMRMPKFIDSKSVASELAREIALFASQSDEEWTPK